MTDLTKQVLAPPRSPLSGDALQLFYRLLAVLLICVVLSLLSNSFLGLGNILNVLRQASLMFFIASGLTLVVLTAGLDLSVGANVALSACLAGTVIQHTGSPALGVLTGLATGGIIGLLNGVMVTALRIPSFIATYGMLWVLNGLTYWYMAGETIHGFPPGFRQIGSGYLFGLPIPSSSRSEPFSRNGRPGARRSTPPAPIRSRRGCRAFLSRDGCCWSMRFPARWRAWRRSCFSPD
jgi:ribose transport system permease protein